MDTNPEATTLVQRNTETILLTTYVKILKSILWFLGMWPAEYSPILRYNNLFIAAVMAVLLYGEINFLYKYYNELDFFTIGRCYITTLFGFAALVRVVLCSFKGYKNGINNFFTSFHLIHIKDGGAYNEKIYRLMDQLSYALTLYSVWAIVFTPTFFNLLPLIENYKNGLFGSEKPGNVTIASAAWYKYPGFDIMNHSVLLSVVNFYGSAAVACVVSMCDLVLLLMILQIIGHVQILRHDLESIPMPGMFAAEDSASKEIPSTVCRMFDAIENEIISRTLIKCMGHHKMIVRFADEISNTFGLLLAFNYLFQLVSLCILLLQCVYGGREGLLAFGVVTVYITGQLTFTSVVYEIVGTVSEKLQDAVYYTPWECMNEDNRKTVCIMLQRVQTPIYVKALGVVPVGVGTMSKVIRTTYTYFMLLQSTNV